MANDQTIPDEVRHELPPKRCRDPRECAAIARVLPLWPHELGDITNAGRHKLLARLRRALRAERRRGIAGHWTYDLARHAELLRIYRRELAAVGGQSPHGPGAALDGPKKQAL